MSHNIRDWIPPGEETPEELAYIRGRGHGLADWVPPEGGEVLEDVSPEEKTAAAMQKAYAFQHEYRAQELEKAQRQLPTLTIPETIALLSSLNEADRQIWLEAERRGLQRDIVFLTFGKPEKEADMARLGGVDPDVEDKPTRGPAELPLDSRSPSDIVHRAVARAMEDVSEEEVEELREGLLDGPNTAEPLVTEVEQTNADQAREQAAAPNVEEKIKLVAAEAEAAKVEQPEPDFSEPESDVESEEEMELVELEPEPESVEESESEHEHGGE